MRRLLVPLIVFSLAASLDVPAGHRFSRKAAWANRASSTAREAKMAALDALVEEGRLFHARTEAEKLLARHPDDFKLRIAYAGILRASGEAQEAIRQYRKAVQLSPEHPDAYTALSQLFMENLDFDRAIDYAQRAVLLAPDSPRARLALVSGLISGQQIDEAERQLESLINRGAADPAVLHLAYEIKLRKGDYQAARQYLETAVALSPHPVKWEIELADVAQKGDNPLLARQLLRTILVKDPACVEARMLLARNLEFYAGDYDGAIKEYQTLLAQDPHSAAALTGIERCRAKKNNIALRLKQGLHSMLDELKRNALFSGHQPRF